MTPSTDSDLTYDEFLADIRRNRDLIDRRAERAYINRCLGKKWADIARLLGFANESSARSAAARYARSIGVNLGYTPPRRTTTEGTAS